NFELDHVYGLTETYGPFTINVAQPGIDQLDTEQRARFKARQGVANICAGELAVVDDKGGFVPKDGQTLGEVVMRGNAVMKGYFDKSEATEKAVEGGWFHSGDVAVWHPGGCIELRGREQDISICGGEHIPTIEVDQSVVEQ